MNLLHIQLVLLEMCLLPFGFLNIFYILSKSIASVNNTSDNLTSGNLLTMHNLLSVRYVFLVLMVTLKFSYRI